MKKRFESLKADKFQPLGVKYLSHVLGGKTTGADREFTGQYLERKVIDPDTGLTHSQFAAIYKTWTSDEITADGTCLYGIGVAYGEWR